MHLRNSQKKHFCHGMTNWQHGPLIDVSTDCWCRRWCWLNSLRMLYARVHFSSLVYVPLPMPWPASPACSGIRSLTPACSWCRTYTGQPWPAASRMTDLLQRTSEHSACQHLTPSIPMEARNVEPRFPDMWTLRLMMCRQIYKARPLGN